MQSIDELFDDLMKYSVKKTMPKSAKTGLGISCYCGINNNEVCFDFHEGIKSRHKFPLISAKLTYYDDSNIIAEDVLFDAKYFRKGNVSVILTLESNSEAFRRYVALTECIEKMCFVANYTPVIIEDAYCGGSVHPLNEHIPSSYFSSAVAYIHVDPDKIKIIKPDNIGVLRND